MYYYSIIVVKKFLTNININNFQIISSTYILYNNNNKIIFNTCNIYISSLFCHVNNFFDAQL